MKRLMMLLLALMTGIQGWTGNIAYGPWVTESRSDRVTICWMSEVPGMAYVELSDGTQVWETFAGRRIFKRLHSVQINGLEPGAELCYRVCGQDLTDDSNARNPRFGDIYEGQWQRVRTFDPEAETCRFSVFNDIHNQVDEYSALAAQVDSAATDFLFLNGDIVSAGNYVADTLVRYELEPLGTLAAGLPVLFARGNHEGRGNNPQLVADIFPNEDPAPFYYTFRQGPVAFIVADGGETGYSRSILYSGSAVYEDYINEQIRWARQAMQEPLFADAPVKICLIHVPMIDHPDKNDYLLQRWLNVHFVPLLDEAGIDLMIGADLHEFMYLTPGTMNNPFPILVNDDVRRLDCSYDSGKLTLTTFNVAGEMEFSTVLEVGSL
ncbi:MAG: metallophosphoesterase [Bacteroidales bacterium]|nr:metallophosphoesterase [Bacteroidales bacterium]